MRARTAALAALVCAPIALTGCGNNSRSNGGSTTAAATTGVAPAASATPATPGTPGTPPSQPGVPGVGPPNPPAPPRRGVWTDRAAPRLLQPLAGAASAAVNGQVFLFGGELSPGVFSDRIHRFDPVQGTVTEELAILPTTILGSGRAHAVAVTVGATVWVFGGSTVGGRSGGVYPELMEFDPAIGALFTQGSLPEARFGMAAAAVGTKVYLFGGSTLDLSVRPASYAPQTQIWEFDTVARTFRTLTSVLPRPLVFARAAAVGGTIYVVGGSNGVTTLVSGFPHTTPVLSDQVYAFDPALDTLTPVAPLPRGRQAQVVAELNGLVYAVSGDTTTGLHDAAAPWTQFTTETLAYDPGTNVWRTLSPIPTNDPALGPLGGRSHAAGAVAGGRIHVLGGYTLPAPGAVTPTSQGRSDLISDFAP